MARYPTFGMEDFESTMTECVNRLKDIFENLPGKVYIQYKMSDEKFDITFKNQNGSKVFLTVSRDIDRVRFHLPVGPLYDSIDDISRDIYDELIYVRSPSTPEIIKSERIYGEWKVQYLRKENKYLFMLYHDHHMSQFDKDEFEAIFSGLWSEFLWYHNTYLS